MVASSRGNEAESSHGCEVRGKAHPKVTGGHINAFSASISVNIENCSVALDVDQLSTKCCSPKKLLGANMVKLPKVQDAPHHAKCS
jgi:hypothetical protein